MSEEMQWVCVAIQAVFLAVQVTMSVQTRRARKRTEETLRGLRKQ